MAVAEQLKVPPRRFEFQMLYGMADPIKEAIQSLGYRVRIYTPYGQLLPGMAYLVRRLLENSSNDSFLRQGFAEGLVGRGAADESRRTRRTANALAEPGA